MLSIILQFTPGSNIALKAEYKKTATTVGLSNISNHFYELYEGNSDNVLT